MLLFCILPFQLIFQPSRKCFWGPLKVFSKIYILVIEGEGEASLTNKCLDIGGLHNNSHVCFDINR